MRQNAMITGTRWRELPINNLILSISHDRRRNAGLVSVRDWRRPTLWFRVLLVGRTL